MLDLVVRDATLVDGTGAPARRADVGVADGRIAAVGTVEDRGSREVDGDGLMVVGDDAQAIYAFRSATVANILEFPSRFPGTTIVKLERNYRSTQIILEAAGAVVSRNTQRKGK